MPPSGVDYASEFLNGYAPEYVFKHKRYILRFILNKILQTSAKQTSLNFAECN